MKHRAAIEQGIGHLKQELWMDRCRLKGIEGDELNAVLSAAGIKAVSLLPLSLYRLTRKSVR